MTEIFSSELINECSKDLCIYSNKWECSCTERNCEASWLAEKLLKAGWVKCRVGEWQPYYEEVECYNSGGYIECRQTGYICSCCQEKKSFTPRPRKFCAECGAKMRGRS